MEIGKIAPATMEKLIFNPIQNTNVKREEVVVRPKNGEDCAALQFGRELAIVSADPITAAVNNAGALAIHICANDIAVAGGTPLGILLTILLPPQSGEAVLDTIMQDAIRTANELNIEIIGGHTEVTDAVTRPVVSGTIIGKNNGSFISTAGAKPGQAVIMTKWAGVEGTSIIAADYEDKLKTIWSDEFIENAKGFSSYISVVEECKLAGQWNVSAMHDATEGGVLGACYELAQCSGVGIEINMDDIPLRTETKEICNFFRINPYRLISSGVLVMACDQGSELVKDFTQKGFQASIIGKIVEEGYFCCCNGEKQVLAPPQSDEIYKL